MAEIHMEVIMSRLEKFVKEAKEFSVKDITASNPEFVAWNNSLIRYMEKKIMEQLQQQQIILKTEDIL